MRQLSLLLSLLLASFVLPAAAEERLVAAEGAVLMEANSERVLYEQDAAVRLPMASTTKVMTAILAIESRQPNLLVTVADEAIGTEGSSMYLKKGEKIRLIDLVYGLMLTSGNDAAVAIACAVAGDVPSFVSMMNRKAQELGLSDTHFVTVNGLHDDQHFTTAKDLARLAAYALRDPDFCTVVSTQYHTTEGGTVRHTLKNKNKLLWNYEGATGVKTGYTMKAGKCLVFSAERDGMQLVGVVLNCPAMWDAAVKLLDHGFGLYSLQPLYDASRPLSIPVANGTKKALCIAPKLGILYPLRKDGSETVTLERSLPESAAAPIEAGDRIGTLQVCINGSTVASVPLIAAETVPKPDFLYYFRQISEAWAS